MRQKRALPAIAAVLLVCLAADGLVLFRLKAPYWGMGLAITVLVLFDAVALALAGLWNGLKCRTLSEAISFSLSSVILVPFAVAAVTLAFGFRTETLAGGILLWAIFCLVVDALAAVSANWMLRNRFRAAASAA